MSSEKPEKNVTPTKPQASAPRGVRKVGKTSKQESGPRGGRKVGKTGQQESGPRGGRKIGKTDDASDRELTPYEPKHPTLQAAGLDQHAVEAERQAELDAEREEHNRRTGDASRASWG